MSLDQVLPSLQSMGLWTYWILALFALLEALVLTGLLVPGGFAVIAGGALAQRGVIDFFDLAWFVAAGAILGAEISFRLGGLANRGLNHSPAYAGSANARRAKAMLERRGGLAMVIGRFFGPLAAFVPFSAAMAGMNHRRFLTWNVVSAVPYALILPAIGYLSGSAIGTMGAAAPRILAMGTVAAVLLGLLWFLFVRIGRAVPVLAEIARSVMSTVAARPAVRAWTAKHPRLTGLAAARFDTTRFLGLTATVLAVLFLYLLGAYVDSVTDFLGSPDVLAGDSRVANLLYALRDSRLIALFGWITAFGGWKIVLTMLAGATLAMLALRRFDLLAGLWLTVIGNQLCVTLLKAFFARPRSDLGYFIETSGSFPSGHAASSVAIWGMLFYLAWRCRLLPAMAAGLAAIAVAFLIGLSRVYLIEHYLSDVLNGYLVGGLWLILGIAFCEWRRGRGVAAEAPGRNRTLFAAGSVVAALAAALTLAFALSSPIKPVEAAAPRTLADPVAALATGQLPRRTETLTGDPRQQVNLVIEAPDAATLTAALVSAGWIPAPRPGIAPLARAFWADWTDASLPDPLVIPTFWSDRPSDLGFARAGNGTAPRLHLRLWDSRFRGGAGRPLFVATLTREDPLDWATDGDSAPTAPSPVRADLADLVAALSAREIAARQVP